MKRIMRKNQVIITVLAVMIAIAGYLTYAGRVDIAGRSTDSSAKMPAMQKRQSRSMIRT